MAVSTISRHGFVDLGNQVSNLDTLISISGSGYTNNASGAPSGLGNGSILVFKEGSVTLQIYLPYGSGRPQYRTYASSWTAWRALY
jgi:hypothetical protein